MSFLAHLGVHGWVPAQHHDLSWAEEVRIVEYWARVIDRDEYGNWIFEEDTPGDVLCRSLWKKSRRKISGWAAAWPSVLAGGRGGGENPSAPEGRAGFTFSGVRTNFSSGSSSVGIDVNLLTQTTQTDPGSSFGQPRADGNSEPNPAGGGDPVATGSKNRCGVFSGSHSALPVYDSEWTPDDRFEAKSPTLPRADGKDVFPKMPKGTFGIMLAGTDEYEQHDLFFPIEPRLVAVNHAGDPAMGSLVCDLNEDFGIDPDRQARLQSMMRVLKKPLGRPNGIGWNLGNSGCEDVQGGYVVDLYKGVSPSSPTPGTDGDRPAVASGGGLDVDAPLGGLVPSGASGGPVPAAGDVSGGADATPPASRVVGLVSVNEGGPFEVGSGKCKHRKGEDEDGHPYVSCHWSTKALYYRNDVEDGPLRFETTYHDGRDYSHYVKVHLGWAGGDWAWWTSSPWYIPPVNLPQPRLRPTGGTTTTGTPTRPGVPTRAVADPVIRGFDWANSLGQAVVACAMQVATSAMLAMPQNFDPGQPALIRKPEMTESDVAKHSQTPVTGNMQSFGAQGGSVPSGYSSVNYGAEGDPWVYTQRPELSKFPGGTAPGGWVLLPPEVGMEDEPAGFAPAGVTKSTTYFVAGPGVYFAAATPELANGGVYTGYSWGVDSTTGDLIFYSHGSDTIQDAAVKFGNTTQDIYWRSGTDFYGQLAHAITADRTWTFPDVSGTVPLGTGSTNQVAYWSGTSSLAGDADFLFDGTTVTFSGIFSGTPSAGRNFVWNEGGIDSDFRVESDDEPYCLMVEGTLNNVVLCASAEPGFNSMDGGVFLGDANVVPVGNPAGGGYLFAEGGALKWRGSSGTVTTMAVA